ncbi:PREDICTED: kelch-like protein 24 [Branchiostoma belcheri]|uniref:Kelch-like protein 24 n=1 Tax=Branchiostoma belcheri TaxID=7741 RepID=A0A6P5A646_BRABE|nr:PREDICTED: kelch-like protein 24 [Branchiostoma belcheri]
MAILTSLEFCHAPHAGEVLRTLQEMRREGRLVDLVLTVDGTDFPCHRAVLASCSAFFRGMLDNNNCSCSCHSLDGQKKFTLQDVTPESLKLLVDYAYTSQVTITNENVMGLLEAAILLKIRPVCDACAKFLGDNVTPSTCLTLMRLGSEFNYPEVVKKAKEVALKNFSTIQNSREFLNLSREQVIKLISNDALNAKNEETVFEAVMRWASHNPDQRMSEMRTLMEHVRLPFVDVDYFKKYVESNEDMKSYCSDLILEAKQCYLYPGDTLTRRTRPRYVSGVRETILNIGGIISGKPTPALTSLVPSLDEPCWQKLAVEMADTLAEEKSFAAVAVGMCDVMISGGTSFPKDVWLYRSEHNAWAHLPEMKQGRWCHSMAALQGKVYAIGGTMYKTYDTVEQYDLSTNEWSFAKPLPEPRQNHASTVCEGKVYVIGGKNKYISASCDVFSYEPSSKTWGVMAPMPEAASSLAAATINSQIYATGGCLRALFCYNATNDVWQTVAQLMNDRSPGYVLEDCGIAACGNKVYVTGGKTRVGERGKLRGTDTVWCYDPEDGDLSDVWPMPFKLHSHGCVTIWTHVD